MRGYGKIAFLIISLFLSLFLIYRDLSAQETWRERIKEKLETIREQRTEKRQKMNEITKPGDYDFSLQQDGLTRTYKVHVPKGYNEKIKTPLILAFHGGGGNSEIMANDEYYGLISKSDKEGFIVAFPNGASTFNFGKFSTWNAGNCCAYAVESKSDDVEFVRKIIIDMEAKLNVNPRRIYAIGMSNGGMFSYRLACDLTDKFKAIASVAGTDNYDGCNPKMPISIMHIHAKDDDHVLFNGGCGPKCKIKSETEFTSVAETISRWVKRNNCSEIPKRVMENEGVYCDLYAGCDSNVRIKLCVTENGGHSWPGGVRKPRDNASTPSQAISAVDEIWDFFKENN
jgi:polyhydroxybutyrate depolymerase